jgi:hypothetical protein
LCRVLDMRAAPEHDHRAEGYCHYQVSSSEYVTVYRAPEPAPYAAADLEFLISAGAQQILFVNGAGSLRPDVPVGSILLPGSWSAKKARPFTMCVQTTSSIPTNN